jgi:proteic killer suppression protein
MAIREVRISKSAKRALKKVPGYIVDKLETWVDAVERDGLHEVRKIPGYHDEPLKGERQGQRSIRLSRDYRAIYTVKHDGEVEFASIEEVSKHDY